jgi:GGDEF domain-containing protein
MPRLSVDSARIVANAIAILLPLNLLVLAFLRERGIISPAGRRRLAMVALQVMSVAILCMPAVAHIAAQLSRAFIPLIFSRWSKLSQPALLAFVLAIAVMTVLLLRRYKAVESSLLWSVVAAFIALRAASTSHLDGVYFAAGGLALIVALIETSYAMAYLDELTQLPSRRSLNEALLKLGDTYSIAMLDVDHFKTFNDTHGHELGDQVLRMVAASIERVGGGGRAFRYGGEEFVVLFPGKRLHEAWSHLEAVRLEIAAYRLGIRGPDRPKQPPPERPGAVRHPAVQAVSVTISVGVAERNGRFATPESVLNAADEAMYRAKQKGRNRTSH